MLNYSLLCPIVEGKKSQKHFSNLHNSDFVKSLIKFKMLLKLTLMVGNFLKYYAWYGNCIFLCGLIYLETEWNFFKMFTFYNINLGKT